jgi:uncharacterized protein YdcH (DUF465 family)
MTAYKWTKAMPKPATREAGYTSSRGEVDKRIASLKEENALLAKQVEGLRQGQSDMAKLADTVNALNKKIEQMESEKAKESGDTKRKK